MAREQRRSREKIESCDSHYCSKKRNFQRTVDLGAVEQIGKTIAPKKSIIREREPREKMCFA